MKATSGLLVLLCGLFFAGVATAHAEDKLQSLFCTMRLGGGGIYTIFLRVPATTSGDCQVANVAESDISGPSHDTVPPIPNPPSRSNGSNPGFIQLTPLGYHVSPAFMLLNGTSLPDLGTLTTFRGTAYEGCRLLTFQKNAVIVVSAGGVTKLLYADLDAGSFARVKAARAPH